MLAPPVLDEKTIPSRLLRSSFCRWDYFPDNVLVEFHTSSRGKQRLLTEACMYNCTWMRLFQRILHLHDFSNFINLLLGRRMALYMYSIGASQITNLGRDGTETHERDGQNQL
jgi:hypothetical protein